MTVGARVSHEGRASLHRSGDGLAARADRPPPASDLFRRWFGTCDGGVLQRGSWAASARMCFLGVGETPSRSVTAAATANATSSETQEHSALRWHHDLAARWVETSSSSALHRRPGASVLDTPASGGRSDGILRHRRESAAACLVERFHDEHGIALTTYGGVRRTSSCSGVAHRHWRSSGGARASATPGVELLVDDRGELSRVNARRRRLIGATISASGAIRARGT